MKKILNKLKFLKIFDFKSKDVRVGDLGEDGELKTVEHGGEEPDPKKSKAKLRGLQSLMLMGLGQVRNGQWYKGYPLMLLFLTVIIVEIATSTYWLAPSEISQYPAEDTLYFFRDYGGLFTKGVWGLITLGAVTTYTTYRGQEIRARAGDLDWTAGDNSRVLLGQGIIIMVVLLIFFALWFYSVRDAYKVRLKVEKEIIIENFKTWTHRIWDDFFAYIIIIPAVLLLIFFTLIPFAFSFLVAFTNYTDRISLGVELIRWDGLTTFTNVFGGQEGWFTYFRQVFGWTIFYGVMSSLTVYILGFFQAMVIESKYVVGKKIIRLILILPWALPGLISLMVFSNIFGETQGLMNQILANNNMTEQFKGWLQTVGLVGQTREGNILWFTSPANALLARFIIIMVNLWMGAPYFMLLITGVLGTIPDSLYEASDIDGASTFQKFRFVTFPWVLRATAPVIITTFTFNFNNFGAIYFLTGGGPHFPRADIPSTLRGIAPGQTDILISWIYKISFQSTTNHFNLAAVYSILIFLLIGVFAVWQLSRLKSFWEED